jgi:hypothetical protein
MDRTEWDGVDRRDTRTNERIAVLESTIADIKSDQEMILRAVQGIEQSMAKYKGVLGGVTFILSAIVTFFSLFGDSIKAHWK